MSRNARGVTLLELIAVIVIFSMLLAFSIGYMRTANKDLGVSAAAHHVVALLRGAHQVSRGTASPAWVVLRIKDGSVYMLAKETIGEWHFEGGSGEGAFGKNAVVSGGTVIPGRAGQGLMLNGGTVDCGEIPVFDPNQGIALDFWVLWKPARGRQVLCTIGKDLEVAIEGDGKVQARVGGLTVTSGDLRLPEGFPQPLWCPIQVLYGAGELKLYINDRLTGSRAGLVTWASGSSLVLGDRTSVFKGAVDEFRVSLIVPRDVYELPGEAQFVMTLNGQPMVPQPAEFVIHFDAEGRLDPARHTQPVKFSLKSSAGERPIEVGLGGAVQRSEEPAEAPPSSKK
jgi:prepilin-type N-terminal cleavage/methylation domain-containing protein